MENVIREPENKKEWEAYYDLRYRVLREPLNQPKGSERNEGDKTGIHFGLYVGEHLKAIARLDEYNAQTVQTRFVAVEPDQQGKGYGKIIMDAVEKKAVEKGYSKMILHARDYAVDFYRKIEYKIVEPSYKLFDVLQHYLMEKKL